MLGDCAYSFIGQYRATNIDVCVGGQPGAEEPSVETSTTGDRPNAGDDASCIYHVVAMVVRSVILFV